VNQSDLGAFSLVILGMAELRGRQLTSAGVKLYWNCLQHLTLLEFTEMATHLTRTCAFMPTPYDFEKLRLSGRATPGEAWSRVLGWTASGSYRDCNSIGDALIDRAVAALGGYRSIAMHDISTLHFAERRFVEHYEAIQDADYVREALPSIARPALPGPTSIAALIASNKQLTTESSQC
jgi:hypothetical protein